MGKRKGMWTGKRIGIAVAAVLLAVAVGVVCWRFVPGIIAWLADAEAVRAFVDEHSLLSRLTFVVINIVQVILAFLPGEPIELASGYAFGFWEGTALCLVASGIATSLIFWSVRRWGRRLVGVFFSNKTFERFAWLQDAKRLELVMLAVFLIPGTPKDFLTYFAGLTTMRFAPVVLIATFGRIPSIVTSTLAASAVGDGNWALAIGAFAVAIVLLAAGGALYRSVQSRSSRKDAQAGTGAQVPAHADTRMRVDRKPCASEAE